MGKAVSQTAGARLGRGICFVAGRLHCGDAASRRTPRICLTRTNRNVRAHQNFPFCVSKWVGFPSVSPPRIVHLAVHSISTPSGTVGLPKSALARVALLR